MEQKVTLSRIFDRLSVLAAIILMAYAVTPFVDIPTVSNSLSLFGILLEFQINFNTYVSILVPALAAVGTYWLIETHPARQKEKYPLLHSILPALTAWVIGLPFSGALYPAQRWVVFALGGALLLIVFLAEYIVVDPQDERHTIAAGILKALSLALFLFLAIAVRAAGLRLYLLLPALAIPALLVLLRTFYLQTGGEWLTGWAIGATLILGQFVTAMHYLPVTPLQFGLFLDAALYAVIDFAIAIYEQRSLRQAVIGPGLIIVILVLLAFLT